MVKPAKVRFLNKKGEWVEELCHDLYTCREHKHKVNETQKILLAAKNSATISANITSVLEGSGTTVQSLEELLSVFDEDINVDNMAYHLNMNKSSLFLSCPQPEYCVIPSELHISEREYRKLLFASDSRVGSKNMESIISPPTEKEISEDIYAYIEYRKHLKSRGYYARSVNLPEGVTEALTALCFNGKLIRSGSGDMLLSDGSINEVKGASSTGPNSFSPSEWFDNLFFVKYNLKTTFQIYKLDINRKDIEKIKVNKRETFLDQAQAGRRPRIIIEDVFIKPHNILPDFTVNVVPGGLDIVN